MKWVETKAFYHFQKDHALPGYTSVPQLFNACTQETLNVTSTTCAHLWTMYWTLFSFRIQLIARNITSVLWENPFPVPVHLDSGLTLFTLGGKFSSRNCGRNIF